MTTTNDKHKLQTIINVTKHELRNSERKVAALEKQIEKLKTEKDNLAKQNKAFYLKLRGTYSNDEINYL